MEKEKENPLIIMNEATLRQLIAVAAGIGRDSAILNDMLHGILANPESFGRNLCNQINERGLVDLVHALTKSVDNTSGIFIVQKGTGQYGLDLPPPRPNSPGSTLRKSTFGTPRPRG